MFRHDGAPARFSTLVKKFPHAIHLRHKDGHSESVAGEYAGHFIIPGPNTTTPLEYCYWDHMKLLVYDTVVDFVELVAMILVSVAKFT